jgi:phosphoglycerol transferase MdoB-like AlkP superfamily enzyme
VIIWESLTAKVVQRLGGVPATPHLDSLIRAGVLFDRMYASGDRSAKGLVAILSGFPAEPHVQIINTPNKAARLPTLARDLRGAGYHTAFYYGGELEFANIKSYLLSGGFERIVGKGDFDPKDWNSKWGTHDHVVLRRLLRDTRAAPHPFFTTLLTLSSHEPFDVPASPAASGADEQSRFLIAHRYTDRSIAEFVRAAQRESWWDSTLIVIVADHGHRWPELPVAEAERASWQYHIPMLWLGGALAKRDTVISTIGSQTDLAPTLLAQLGLSGREYRWGKNLLASDARPFAFFAYHDGFGFVDPNGRLVYDETGRRVIEQEGAVGEPEVRSGMAYLRLSYQDYLDK